MLDPEGRYLLVGRVERGSRGVVVTVAGGGVAVEDAADSLEKIEAFLLSLDGARTLAQVLGESSLSRESAMDLLDALVRARAVYDVRQTWRRFHEASSLPWLTAPPLTESEAYALTRWRPTSGDLFQVPAAGVTRLGGLAAQRRSADLAEIEFIDPRASFDAALRVAADAYQLRAGSRTVASAGAMWPLHLWVVGQQDRGLTIVAVDGSSDSAVVTHRLELHTWIESFVPDPAVISSLGAGAATIVITADPTRIVGKYGERGWRYVLFEAGAVSHHATLIAAEQSWAMRPIGGFFDDVLARNLNTDLLPLLTLVLAAA